MREWKVCDSISGRLLLMRWWMCGCLVSGVGWLSWWVSLWVWWECLLWVIECWLLV